MQLIFVTGKQAFAEHLSPLSTKCSKWLFLLYVAENLKQTYRIDCSPVKELEVSYDVSALYNIRTKAISNHSRLSTVTNIITVGVTSVLLQTEMLLSLHNSTFVLK